MKSYVKKFDISLGENIGRWPESWHDPLARLCVIVSPISWVFVLIAGALLAIYFDNSFLTILSIVLLISLPLADLMKVIVRRPRPISLYVDTMKLRSYSFPSTHAYTAGIGSGYLAVFASQYIGGVWLYLLAGVMAVLAVVVALSRVYLKAHFPSDVVAGLLLSGAVLVVLVQGLQ